MEITKHKVMFSILIALVMTAIGLFISNGIADGIVEKNEQYYKAVKITDAKQFQYGLQTGIGNALVYGLVNAVEPVKMSEVKGEWFYIERVKERYTRHTKEVTETDSKGKKTTKTKVYYEWDRVGSDALKANGFSFMSEEFNNNLSGLPTMRLNLLEHAADRDKVHWNYLYEKNSFLESVGDVRYYFYVIPKSFSATLEIKLKRNEIASWSDKPILTAHYETTIQNMIERLEDSAQTASLLFWIIWCITIVAAIIAFCYLDNCWLEEKRPKGE